MGEFFSGDRKREEERPNMDDGNQGMPCMQPNPCFKAEELKKQKKGQDQAQPIKTGESDPMAFYKFDGSSV